MYPELLNRRRPIATRFAATAAIAVTLGACAGASTQLERSRAACTEISSVGALWSCNHLVSACRHADTRAEQRALNRNDIGCRGARWSRGSFDALGELMGQAATLRSTCRDPDAVITERAAACLDLAAVCGIVSERPDGAFTKAALAEAGVHCDDPDGPGRALTEALPPLEAACKEELAADRPGQHCHRLQIGCTMGIVLIGDVVDQAYADAGIECLQLRDPPYLRALNPSSGVGALAQPPRARPRP